MELGGVVGQCDDVGVQGCRGVVKTGEVVRVDRILESVLRCGGGERTSE
jgi:hypothetical protein